MKIQNYNIEQVAASDLKKYKSSLEKLTVITQDAKGNMETRTKDINPGSMESSDFANISEEARKMLDSLSNEPEEDNKMLKIPEKELEMIISSSERQKIRLLEEMFGRFIGKRHEFKTIEKFEIFSKNIIVTINGGIQTSKPAGRKTDAKAAYTHTQEEMYTESEAMAYKSRGEVETQDGRKIEFSIELMIARAYSVQKFIQQNRGDTELIDPLVINFGDSAPSLSNKKIMFDLNADGIDDYISFVGQDSGFIVLDRNKDGQVNDGTEVFGTKAGDGFTELSEYDTDGNDWIDENDPIFNELSIWKLGEDSEPELVALGKQGVGAIYLGNVSSKFHLTDSANKTDGVIQKTGVFLNEDGSAGTMHHIDFAI